MKNRIEIVHDNFLIAFFVSYFFIHALNLLVKITGLVFPQWEIISKIPLVFLLFLSLYVIIKREKNFFISTIVVVISLFVYTFLRDHYYFIENKDIFIDILVIYIPLGMSVVSLRNKKKLLKCLYLFSWIIHPLIIYTMIVQGIGTWTYSMSLGYALVFQALIFWEHFFHKKTFYDLVVVAIDFVLIILFASRGPIICFIFFLIAELVFSRKISNLKKISHIIFLVAGCVFLVAFSNDAFKLLESLSSSFTHSSRNIIKFSSGDFLSDSGRSALTDYYFEKIRSNWLFGFGIAGGWISQGDYPHNLFVELLLSYGVVCGPLVFIILIYIFLKGLNAKHYDTQRLFILLTAYCSCLLVSSSYAICPHFFVIIIVGIKYVFELRDVRIEAYGNHKTNKPSGDNLLLI